MCHGKHGVMKTMRKICKKRHAKFTTRVSSTSLHLRIIAHSAELITPRGLHTTRLHKPKKWVDLGDLNRAFAFLLAHL